MPKRILVVDADERHRRATEAGIKHQQPKEEFEFIDAACHQSALAVLMTDDAIEGVCLHGQFFERDCALKSLSRPKIYA